MESFPAATLLALIFLAAAQAGAALQFRVVNAIADTATGQNFDADIGSSYARQVMADATSMAWKTLGQRTASDRKAFTVVTLSVEGSLEHRGSRTEGSTVHLGCGHATDIYTGPETFDKEQVTGVIYHEVANVWQFDGNGHANAGLLAGIADLVQMKAGHTPAHWAREGEGDRWDERRPGVTARFLAYCEAQRPGFVAELGRKLKNGYSDRFFADITGKTVNKLWREYKAAMNAE